MLDYMCGLQKAFYREPDCRDLQKEIDRLHQELIRELDKEQRRKLLRLLDMTLEMQDRIALANFTAGFRLAGGIAAELQREEVYSFIAEEERNAGKGAGKEEAWKSRR